MTADDTKPVRENLASRSFEVESFKEAGLALGASDHTAKKQVNRMLEKPGRFFLKRGVVLSTTTIAGAVMTDSVNTAPAAAAKSVAARSIQWVGRHRFLFILALICHVARGAPLFLVSFADPIAGCGYIQGNPF